MKKFILFLTVFLGFAVSSFAQTEKYTSSQVTVRVGDKWEPWTNAECSIEIDYDEDVVRIDSYVPQVYHITGLTTPPPDNNGVQKAFSCTNEKGEECRIRFRIQKNNTRQIYIDNWKEDTTTVYTLQKGCVTTFAQ
jgi:hypothetical protein